MSEELEVDIEKLGVRELLKLGMSDVAKEKAKSAGDFIALAEVALDPFGNVRARKKIPADFRPLVEKTALEFAQNSGAAAKVIKALEKK